MLNVGIERGGRHHGERLSREGATPAARACYPCSLPKEMSLSDPIERAAGADQCNRSGRTVKRASTREELEFPEQATREHDPKRL